MITKICSACHQELPIDSFHKDSSKKDGHRTNCKECYNSKTRICLYCKKRLPSSLFGLQSVLCKSCAATHKQCPTCQEVKPHSAFYKNPSQSYGIDAHCIECARDWAIKYRSTPKWKQADKQYRQEYQQTQNYKDSQWRYRQSPKGRIVMRRGWRRYYYSEKGQKTIKQSYKRWMESEQGRKITRHQAKRYRARKLDAVGSHTADEFILLCAIFKNRCLCCGRKRKLTEDHIVPLTMGGSDDISNIQPLCISCNSSKNNRSTVDYRPYPITRQTLMELVASKECPPLTVYQQLPIPHLLEQDARG